MKLIFLFKLLTVAQLTSFAFSEELEKPLWYLRFSEASHLLVEGTLAPSPLPQEINITVKKNNIVVGESRLESCTLQISEKSIANLVERKNQKNFTMLELEEINKSKTLACFREIIILDGFPVIEGPQKFDQKSWFVINRIILGGESYLRIVAQVHNRDFALVKELLNR